MDLPIVDVIIPNRNKAAFLPQTIAALRGQTFTNWRAIVIDGESTDGSWDLLKAAQNDDRRFVIRQSRAASATGQSLYRSWNQGLTLVRAPYFGILTSDDLWDVNWLAAAVAKLDRTPSAVAAIARVRAISENSEDLGLTPACEMLESSLGIDSSAAIEISSQQSALRALLLGPIFSSIHSVVARGESIANGVMFSEDVGYLADIEYYLHLCFEGSVVYMPEFHADFRVYGAQASSEAKGVVVNRLWTKVVRRNSKFCARHVGIEEASLRQLTEAVLARHRFLMSKPDKKSLHKSPVSSAFRALSASLKQPLQALAFVRSLGKRQLYYDDFCWRTAAAAAKLIGRKQR